MGNDVRGSWGLGIVVWTKSCALEDQEGVGYVVTHGAVEDAVVEDVVIATFQVGGFGFLVGGG